MILLDSSAVYLTVFSPLLASVFITLIPPTDISSKRSISRFFALIGFVAYLRIFFLFLNHKLLEQYTLSFNLTQFYINFVIHIDKYNIFLFGAISAAILINIMLHELTDIKSNAHQVAPFILAFILFITFGQKDLRIALPIISIANFIIYFLMGSSDKIRRGSTIFYMGTFLFTCDTLALILLQYQEINADNSWLAKLFQVAILIPGFARLLMPVFAPFMKNLFLNLDESEGPFISIFLQLAGFFILILYRLELSLASEFITQTVEVIACISALYIAFLALTETRSNLVPYYFLVFYSSCAAYLLFVTNISTTWHISSSILLTNLACFLHNTKTSLLVSQYQNINALQARTRATWFLSLCLCAGIPGIGIGTALWNVIYFIISQQLMSLSFALSWALALILMQYALIISARKEYFSRQDFSLSIVDFRLPITKTFVVAPILIALVTLAIPIITTYTAHRVS
jgi:hypothetical protein